ncbi:pyruvate decarboxylase-like protein [Massariosphaeria phaeospora]|uniref:Pyruvate decarboxylase n=1 Tax=Massariosphaeria phaeospora TaxID=100035 RepID=A0A7C8IBM7_9PLEO|nr:pyruvate decarboxylase-like protein [Massariosphaeria phaeospora]
MSKITLGRYMWERIHQVGVDTIFGVPGDFNLKFLDEIYHVEGLRWLGNQNELNASYAADGYGRIKGVPGVFVTTHGVGELSAINGVAGAMSERVKVIHVVGQTPRAMQKAHMMIHHSIGEKPDHQLYNNASRGLRIAAAELWDVETAPAEIDRVIRECFIKSGPVYIFMPLDLSTEEVSADLLKTPLDVSPHVDQAAQEKAVAAINSAIASSKNPAILVDALAHRFNAAPEAKDLVKKLRTPFFASNMGKSVVDETDEMYVGVWNGDVGTPGVKEVANASDLVITLGYLPGDTNSGGFSRQLEDGKAIHINPFSVVVKGETYPNIYIKPLLAALTASLPSTPQHTVTIPELPPPRIPVDKDATHITQSWLWPNFESFLRPGDVVIGETGTTLFGLCDTKFPSNVRWHAQIYYGSIGFATAATLGAEIARKELEDKGVNGGGRTVLVTGDGSLALTMQEIGTMIKAGIKPVIFVINNEGYTIERLIWGARQGYNDIVPTAYSHLLPLYKHPSPEKSYHFAKTKTEFEAVLAKPELSNPDALQLVEVVVDKMDTAWRLPAQLASRGKADVDRLTKAGFVDTYGNWGLEGVSNGGVKWN